MNAALDHFKQNKESFLEELKKLVRIPSISFDGFDPKQVDRSADAVAKLLKETGLENVEILKLADDVHPYVYADWLHAPGAPTVLLYAHHDVQPPMREEVWKTPPFEPTEKNGRLYGRGTADDKAGVLIHVAAIASYLRTSKKLPLNVKLLIEGEEEIGSTHLAEFLKKYKTKLKSDAMVLTDTQNFDCGVPALTTSLRGVIIFDVELHAIKSPKHSGMWGGPVPDPGVALSKMIASCTDAEGRLSVPGIWDEVRPLAEADKRAMAALPMDLEVFKEQVELVKGARLVPGKNGKVEPFVQIWREPAFSINAMEVSTRKNASSVINDKAWARIGIRIVPDMDPKRTATLIEEHLKRMTPWGLRLEMQIDVGGKAWGITPEGSAFDAAVKSLEKGYGVKPVFMGCGGSIPFVEPMAEQLGGIPALLVGVEDPYTNAHSENESMLISDFYKCIESMIYFYNEYKG